MQSTRNFNPRPNPNRAIEQMEQIGEATVLPAMDAFQRILSEHSDLQWFRSEYETTKAYLEEMEEAVDVTERQLEDAESEIAENERIRNKYREEQREMTRMIVDLESHCVALQTERDRIERALQRVVSSIETQKRLTGQKDNDENDNQEIIITNLEKSLEELVVENQELRLQIKEEKIQSAVSQKEVCLLKRQLEEALQSSSKDKALLKDLRAPQNRKQEPKGQQLIISQSRLANVTHGEKQRDAELQDSSLLLMEY